MILPAARIELIAAQDWYEQASPGLGRAFRNEVDREIGRILENPRRFPAILRDVRRARLRRFPYGLFFREREGSILLIACFHGSRDPLTWTARVTMPYAS
ncbi:MAG: type II toxin-antitoxin system RelE/ParE family toxin [Phenylobacterium sp.]|uniref:type II toxin-antitoxin system RelE/ParE family toxin n=1 Tax=Phenylobacterium sp. TaxID=1871053 RepID=UPI001A2F71BF|nr:type II toxin-antitoxin system RelE/ParE family toxin [Phenylobacterium sp.]MBJ7413349.1 type II toxin-antitoxin system RelE/ParE family toxin [Phenylobacterium sp.]